MDRAAQIVEAMRRSVAAKGAAGATFDHVAREAGVSRGLLHYYFGSKERLLIEVVRRDAEVRLGEMERQLAGVRSPDDFLEVLVVNLREVVRLDAEVVTLGFELFTLARRNEEIATEFIDVQRRMREHVAAVLTAKRDEGVLDLADEPEAIADVLLSLADGLSIRMLAEPERDITAAVQAAVRAVRGLLTRGS